MDYSHALGAELRKVDQRVRDGQPVRVVAASRTYETDRTGLWDALTSQERIPQWFLPISGELQLNGHYQLEGNAGGVIERCEPPTAFAVTWEIGGQVSWVAVMLAPIERGTRLTLEHTISMDAASEAHWNRFGPGATGVGWDLAMFGLALHIEHDGANVAREETYAWMGSDAGKAFVRACAAAWGVAHTTAGEVEAVAQSMAQRTGDFYAGG